MEGEKEEAACDPDDGDVIKQGIFDLCGVDDFAGCVDESDDDTHSEDAPTPEGIASLLSTEIVLVDGLPDKIVAELNSYFGDNPKPPFKLDLTDRSDIAKQILSLCYADISWGADWLARIRLNQYHLGGRFEWHQDQVVKTLPEQSSAGRDTTNTVLVYLTDCDRGGQTEFIIRKGAAKRIAASVAGDDSIRVDELQITSGSKHFDKISVKPRKGRCVIFDHNVRHQALPASQTKRIAQFKFYHPEKVHPGRDKLGLLDAQIAHVTLGGGS